MKYDIVENQDEAMEQNLTTTKNKIFAFKPETILKWNDME